MTFFKKNLFFFLLILCGFCGNEARAQGLKINEYVTLTASGLTDEDGDMTGWMEIFNTTEAKIDLANYSIRKGENPATEWKFPSVVIPGEGFLMVYTSGKNRTAGEFLHTNFTISGAGEKIFIADKKGKILDSIETVSLSAGQAFGRQPDGSFNLVLMTGASPNKSNKQKIINTFTESVSFSKPAGRFDAPFSLELSSQNPDAEIYYTLDGSEPTPQSQKYSGAISIESQDATPNLLSMIPTNPEKSPIEWRWLPPLVKTHKINVVRARAFQNAKPVSRIFTQSYLISPEQRYELPVISLVSDSANFFGFDEGIYVPGVHYTPNTTSYWGTGNYKQEGIAWERPVHIEFFEANESAPAISMNAGVRLHGNATTSMPMKSLRIYAREAYQAKDFNYKIFPERDFKGYKNFLLRNSGQDFTFSMFRDALVQRISRNLNGEHQLYRPAIVFLNGEYWGIHNIYDRVDDNFLKYTSGAGDVDMLEQENIVKISEGDSLHYAAMVDYTRTADLTADSTFERLSTMMDVDNYLDYVTTKLYVATYDWPGNNVKMWRPQTADGKWRWIIYDNDDAMINPEMNSLTHATCDTCVSWPNFYWSTEFFRNLLKNGTFKENFLTRFEQRLQSTFKTNTVTKIIRDMAQVIGPYMPEHIERWRYPASVEQWDSNVATFIKFARERPCIMRRHIMETFGITDTSYASGVCLTTDVLEQDYRMHGEFDIYPNPGDGLFTFRCDMRSEKISISVYNMLGARVFQTETVARDVYSIDLRSRPAGMYRIVIQSGEKTFTENLVIVR